MMQTPNNVCDVKWLERDQSRYNSAAILRRPGRIQLVHGCRLNILMAIEDSQSSQVMVFPPLISKYGNLKAYQVPLPISKSILT